MNLANKIGLKIGLIAAVFYAIAVLIRYHFFADNLFEFSLVAAITFMLFIAMWVWAAVHYRSKSINSLEIKDIFRTILIVVIIGELSFAITNYLYLHEWNTNFFQEFHDSNKSWMDANSKWSKERQQETLNDIINQKNTSLKQVLQSFLTSIIKDSILGIIIALIIKRTAKKI